VRALRAPLIEDTLGWILLAQGEADKALTYLTKLSAPKNPDIQYHQAVALTRLGRTGDVQARLEMLLGSGATFSDRAEAEKLLQQLKRG
jgi:cellulose synthase operon protein C